MSNTILNGFNRQDKTKDKNKPTAEANKANKRKLGMRRGGPKLDLKQLVMNGAMDDCKCHSGLFLTA